MKFPTVGSDALSMMKVNILIIWFYTHLYITHCLNFRSFSSQHCNIGSVIF